MNSDNEKHRPRAIETLLLTVLALVAFSANSVFCRLALKGNNIDASSFTMIRLLSGALILWLILNFGKSKQTHHTTGSWFASAMLLVYASTFSFAYLTLETGTGALILFGAVQITMVLSSLLSGHRLHITEWFGIFIAFYGFIYLTLPGINAPPLSGFLLMSAAGIAWGIYTLKGQGSLNPLKDTVYNFTRTLPFIALLTLFTLSNSYYSLEGVLFAILSGALASGIGYTIWYTALRGLSTVQAAVVQLSVPVIAALGGTLFISEPITLRLSLSAAMILGGILSVVLGRYYVKPNKGNQ